MSKIGDNDDQSIMVFDANGNAITGVDWPEARRMIALALMGNTANEAWAIDHAEFLLCSAFSGASAGKQS